MGDTDPSRHRESLRITLVVAISLVFALGASAQMETIWWQVAFNGGGFGPVQTVTAPAGGPVFAFVAEGIADPPLTLTATLIGQEIPGIAPLRGRHLIVTGATASVAPGYFTPLGNPFPTIELLACYDFPLSAVGPPRWLGDRLNGFFTNVGGLGNNIDFARVGKTLLENGCLTGDPGPAYTFNYSTLNSIPPRGFDTGIVPLAFFTPPVTTFRLSNYHRFVVQNDGDAVVLPGSSETIALPEPSVGMALIVISPVLLAFYFRRHRNS